MATRRKSAPKPAPTTDSLARLREASPFLDAQLTRHPRLAAQAAKAEAPAAMAARIAKLPEDDLAAALRIARQRELARIVIRDFGHGAALDETLQGTSSLAQACLRRALASVEATLHERHGRPRDEQGAELRPYILGMGKLGGGELNLSSDVDLILGYPASGETDGRNAVSNEEYFERLAKDLTRLLAQRTPEGFVYRVDWMLRPFGSSGPPAMTSGAMEDYYQSHGREWERYAMIKARIVAGDEAAGAALLQALQPFVYRRYLDFTTVGALRSLKRSIEAEVERKDLHDNIKLGSGGIREIEFVVQAFQLMRGGQDPALRDARLRPVLRHLGERGLLKPEAARGLDEAYVFLRRLENALQARNDEQTHALPPDDAGRAAVASLLGVPDWDPVQKQLDAVRLQVRAEFDRLFAAPVAPSRQAGAGAAVALLWQNADLDAATSALRTLGYEQDPHGLAEAIRALRQSRLTRLLSDAALQNLEALIAVLLEELRGQPAPETAVRRVLEVLGAVAGRSTYLALLRESPGARRQLAKLCAASPWITGFIAQAPAVLDQLLDERSLYAPPDREQMQADLDARCTKLPAGDTEAAMNALRLFRQETMLRIAAADLMQALPLVKISDRLTWLAEVILGKALELIRAELTREHGRPHRADGAPAQFAVIAYGKFGGIEMGYGSDLDIVFVHDCDALSAETKAARGQPITRKAIPNEVWLARLGQRIVHWLSTQTAAGRAYEVDLELRPDGRRGLTTSSLETFTQYQMESAWTWEHQALTRARPVAGEPGLQARVVALRRAVLGRARDGDKLREEVSRMRLRMREALDKSHDGRFDVKHGEGGLTDIEFITQYLVLRHAAEAPGLTEWTDNWRQTEALVAAGKLDAADGEALIGCYRAYRGFLHQCDLQQAEPMADDSVFEATRAQVRALWKRFGL